MWRRRVWYPLIRFAFHLFYNPFAFTYDWVSQIVSRGNWRAWTRAAIPRIAGSRVLEVPCGTGNLLLDLMTAGYAPVGVDLSPSMLHIARGKLSRQQSMARHPALLRARVEALPFATGGFDTVIMTFPPGFVYNPRALAELRRMLDKNGRLVWVDAGRLIPCDGWSRMLNGALDATSGDGSFETTAVQLLAAAGFRATVEWVEDKTSLVAVVTATKGAEH